MWECGTIVFEPTTLPKNQYQNIEYFEGVEICWPSLEEGHSDPCNLLVDALKSAGFIITILLLFFTSTNQMHGSPWPYLKEGQPILIHFEGWYQEIDSF